MIARKMGYHFNKGKLKWESRKKLLSLLLSTSEKFFKLQKRKFNKNPFNMPNISIKMLIEMLKHSMADVSGA